MRPFAALAMVLLCSAGTRAQEVSPELRDLIEQRIESIAEQLDENSDVDLSALAEQLMDRISDPVDINRADAEELASLHLLSDIQINAIGEHVRRFGKFISIYELQTVDAMDPATLEVLRPFVTIHGEERSRIPLREMLANGSNEVILRTRSDIEQRKGYQGQSNFFGTQYAGPDDGSPDADDPHVLDSLRRNGKAYLGSPWKAYARYRFRYRQNIDLGVTGEKDEGEQFFKGGQKQGFDFYSAHLFLRHVGPLKAVALGDLQAQFGQGLVFSSGLSYARKSSFTMNIKKNFNGLSPYTSVNENQFLRGAGATVGLGERWEGTAFISHKRIDANVAAADTSGTDATEAIFSSFLEDGYHRTSTELGKKDAIDELIYGGNLRYKGRGFSLGATAAQVNFGNIFQRSLTRAYNQFDFQGGTNSTYGLDWNVLYHNLSWFGEGARSANGGLAGVTGLLAALDKHLSLALLYRDLQRNFQGLYSSAFEEGSSPWNERGLYAGIELRPDRQWTLNAYYDQFTFPWLRYQVDGPSDGHEVLAQITWTPSKKVQLYVKARKQMKQVNTEEDVAGVPPLVPVDQVNYRFNASYKVSDGVTLRTRVETVDYQRGGSPTEHGFLLYQDLVHRPLKGRVEFTGRLMLFSTESYDARLYAFESDIPGVFSLPPIYGRGMLWYFMVRYSPARHLQLWVRYGATIYNDRYVISSGLQEIADDHRSTLKMELRYLF